MDSLSRDHPSGAHGLAVARGGEPMSAPARHARGRAGL